MEGLIDDDDETEIETKCPGIGDRKPCGQIAIRGLYCEDCAHEERILGLIKQYKPHADKTAAKTAEKKAKAAETKRQRQEAKRSGDSQQKPPRAAMEHSAEQPQAAPPLPPDDPEPVAPSPPPQPAQPAARCTKPGCHNEAENHELCKGCYGSYRMWLAAAIENKTCPILLDDATKARYKEIAEEHDI